MSAAARCRAGLVPMKPSNPFQTPSAQKTGTPRKQKCHCEERSVRIATRQSVLLFLDRQIEQTTDFQNLTFVIRLLYISFSVALTRRGCSARGGGFPLKRFQRRKRGCLANRSVIARSDPEGSRRGNPFSFFTDPAFVYTFSGALTRRVCACSIHCSPYAGGA